jgi:hypothetical protein
VLLGGGQRKGRLVLVVAGGDLVASGGAPQTPRLLEPKGRGVECCELLWRCGEPAAGGKRVYNKSAAVGCGSERSSCLWLAGKK